MTHDQDQNQYAKAERFDRYIYDFRCPACGAHGELDVAKNAAWGECPEKCGARFVQWRPPTPRGQTPRVALRCINEAEARMGVEFARRRGPRMNGSR